MRPEVLILDEPTAGLDPAGRGDILGNITEYHRQTGSTVLLVSHNMDDVARIAERIIVFHSGAVAMDGTPAEVFSHGRELESMGLSVPDAAKIAGALRERGVQLPEGIYTTDALESAILALKGGGAPC